MSIAVTPFVDGRAGRPAAAARGFGRDLGADQDVVWIDAAEPDEAELVLLQEELGLPASAVSDLREARQRPKVVAHDEDVVLVVLHAVLLAPEDESASFHEVDLLVSRSYVLTVRQRPALDAGILHDALTEPGAPPLRTPSAVADAVLDRIVEGYFAVADEIETRIETVDERVWDGLTKEDLARAFALRRDLVRIRRVIAPLREVLTIVVRREHGVLDDALDQHLRDLHDQVVTVHEQIELSRDLLASTMDGHLSIVSNRMNETVLKVSAWAAIIAVPTVIASIYGMNFRDMPELGWSGGYPASLVLMAAAAGALYATFKRRGWL